MITRDLDAFFAFARTAATDFGPATARAAFLVAPEGFALAAESASDNAYMDLSVAVDPARALAQHRALQSALSQDLPVVCFSGDGSIMMNIQELATLAELNLAVTVIVFEKSGKPRVRLPRRPGMAQRTPC